MHLRVTPPTQSRIFKGLQGLKNAFKNIPIIGKVFLYRFINRFFFTVESAAHTQPSSSQFDVLLRHNGLRCLILDSQVLLRATEWTSVALASAPFKGGRGGEPKTWSYCHLPPVTASWTTDGQLTHHGLN